MQTNKCQCCKNESARKFEKVCQILDSHGRKKNNLIPILQEIQAEYRYLPEEVMTFVATSLDISPARVFGVASFYANFALTPKGKYVIHICDGTACHVKGAGDIKTVLQEKFNLSDDDITTKDMLFTVEAVSCLGACGLAPVITINNKVYGQVTPEKAVELVDQIITEEANNAN